jgi:hypothetical protein
VDIGGLASLARTGPAVSPAVIIRRAYEPVVAAMAAKASMLSVRHITKIPEIEVGQGLFPDQMFDRIELARTDLLVPAPEVSPPGQPDYVSCGPRSLPVGQYGVTLPRTLVEAFTLWRLPGEIPESLFPTDDHFNRLGIPVNFRSPDARATAMVGVFSILQSSALLTPYNVEGFDDAFELLKSIPARVYIELGARTPWNVIAPMTNKGYFFPGPVLQRANDGTVELAGEFQEFLDREKQIYLCDTQSSKSRQEVARTSDHITQGGGCPVDFEPLIAPVIDWVVRRHQFTSTS